MEPSWKKPSTVKTLPQEMTICVRRRVVEGMEPHEQKRFLFVLDEVIATLAIHGLTYVDSAASPNGEVEAGELHSSPLAKV